MRVKKVLHGEAAAALRSVGQNSSLLDTSSRTIPAKNLADKISGAQPLVIAPAVVVILGCYSSRRQLRANDASVRRANLGDHPTGVDCQLYNGDFTATGLDYTPTTGSLHWDAGDNSPRTINVPVLADAKLRNG